MTVTRLDSGGYNISRVVDNHLEQRRYFGYTRREAEARFRLEMLEIKNGRAARVMTNQTTTKKD